MGTGRKMNRGYMGTGPKMNRGSGKRHVFSRLPGKMCKRAGLYKAVSSNTKTLLIEALVKHLNDIMGDVHDVLSYSGRRTVNDSIIRHVLERRGYTVCGVAK